MNLIDKILLILMVVILPLGLVGTYTLLSANGESESEQASEEPKALDAAKLEELVNRLSQQPVGPVPTATPKAFSLQSVSFATESGKLVLNGIAPESVASVLVSTTLLPNPSAVVELGETTDSDVLGRDVEISSVIPKNDGSFRFEREIDEEDFESIIELRLEQNLSVRTVRFDLKERKQIL